MIILYCMLARTFSLSLFLIQITNINQPNRFPIETSMSAVAAPEVSSALLEGARLSALTGVTVRLLVERHDSLPMRMLSVLVYA